MVGQNRHSLTFEHKLWLQLQYNYMYGIGTEYTSHDKEICQHCKRIINNFKKSINQIRPLLMQWWKTSYKLGTDVKRGEQYRGPGFESGISHSEKLWGQAESLRIL